MGNQPQLNTFIRHTRRASSATLLACTAAWLLVIGNAVHVGYPPAGVLAVLAIATATAAQTRLIVAFVDRGLVDIYTGAALATPRRTPLGVVDH